MLRLLFTPAAILLFSSYAPTARRGECDQMPALNREVVAFVKSKIRQTVGRGECWDLAAEALNSTGAAWDHHYGFGKEISPVSDCVYPGDIIQFEGVTVKYQKDGYLYEEIMSRHTAVIFTVKGKGSYVVAEQNTSAGGRKVTLNPLELRNVVTGKYSIYRPVKD